MLEENAAAVNFLKKFLTQENLRLAQFPSLILKGEKSCGKTHLLHIFAKKYHVEFLKKEKIPELNLGGYFKADKFYIIEDINEIKDEELIFHMLNSAVEAEAFLILTTSQHHHFALRDLTSRLKNIFTIEIKNPSHEAVIQLLANGFSRRQIKIPSRALEFICDHISREYESIIAAIKKVEFFCSESGKNISMKELKRLFKNN